MRRRQKGRRERPATADAGAKRESRTADAAGRSRPGAADEVRASAWNEPDVARRRKSFPEPGPIDEPLRIAMTGEASAEVVAHAKGSLHAEVCGVLLGEVCEDDQGIWVLVDAVIRGMSTGQSGTHVTYTQETWEKIYEVKDREYPKSTIVGWYHSHPGFGVEFSRMDLFIQENFFAGPTQFALVLDPLAGDEAICANTPEGTRYVSRFWLDGRPRTCRVPRAARAAPESTEAAPGDLAARLQAVEHRLQQVLQATDEERAARHRARLTVGMLVAAALVAWIGLGVFDRLFPRFTPPESIVWSKIPVKIGDKTALLGVNVVSWELPTALHAAFVDAVKQQLDDEAKKRQEEQEAQKGTPPDGGDAETK